jgi:hypothetical protein
LPNKNESATVAKPKNFRELNKALVGNLEKKNAGAKK